MDIMVHATYDLGENGMFEGNIWMFGGMAFFLLLSYLIPEKEEHTGGEDEKHSKLERMGVMTALGISLHNLPEGLVVFNATVVGVCNLATPSSLSLQYVVDYLTQCTGRGLAVAVAIALHNIPEGIAVALPIYCSTNRFVCEEMVTRSKWEAMKWCLLSSICEPIAAILFGLLFNDFLTPHMMAALNASVAGIMIILCIYELIPTALQYTNAKVGGDARGDL